MDARISDAQKTDLVAFTAKTHSLPNRINRNDKKKKINVETSRM